MSEVVGEGVLRIKVDDSAVGSSVDAAGKTAGGGYSKGFLGGLGGLAVGIGGLVAAAGAASFVKGAIADAREAQKVTAATGAIIKATGAAAGLSADQIGDLSGALAAKTGVDDGQIQAGANLLLTFKNVKKEGEGLNDVFGRATQAGLDLAAAGFGSVEGNAVQLGKALNDPLKGIAALAKSGVTFTEGQKEQIKGFVASNDLLSAQKIILGEVEAQVGGTAEATATSGEKAAYAFGELRESVGTALLPVLDTLANLFVDKIAPALADAVGYATKLGPVFSAVGDAISGAFAGGGGASALEGLRGSLSSLAATLQGAFTAALPVVSSLLSSLGEAAQAVLPIIADLFINQVLPAVTSLASYVATNLFPIFLQIVGVVRDQLIPTFVSVATFIYGTVAPALLQIATTVATNLKPVFDAIVAVVRDTLIPTFSNLVATFRDQLLPVLQPLIEKLLTIGGAVLSVASTILGAVLPVVLRFAGFLLSNLVPAIAQVVIVVVRIISFLASLVIGIGTAIGKVAGFGSALVGLVKGGLDLVVDAIAGLPGRVLALGGRLLDAGRTIIGKFLEGLKGVGSFASGIADAVFDAVRGVVNSAIDRLNGLLSFTINVGPKSFTVNPPDIGHLQTGTLNARAGTYVVGEVGPERVTLPDGARVDTAAQTRQQGGVDYDALAAAVAAALAPLLQAMRPITIPEQVTDPEAAAMLILNRLVTQ